MPSYKTCPTCGNDFRVKPSHYDKKTYCSRSCMAAGYRVRLAGESNPNYRAAGMRACEYCGVGFQSYNKNQRCCSKACGQRWRAMQPNRPPRKRPVRKPRPHVEKRPRIRVSMCVTCGATVEASGRRKYCKACHAQRTAGLVTGACVICGAEVRYRPYTVKRTCSPECNRKHRSNRQKGEQSHRWQGGKTDATFLFRCSMEYDDWRKRVFARDNYTCALCGAHGGKLSAHHIRPFATHRDIALEDWNGITLCWPCHAGIRHKEAQYEEQFLAITEKGRIRPEQEVWIAELDQVPGVTARIVRPSDWESIESLLRGSA